MKKEPITLALPKGRLEEQVRSYFADHGLAFEFKNRQLVAEDEQGLFRIFLVKNADLPTYVHHGIAGLGVSGEDTLYEAGYPFNKLMGFPFGSTRMCLAGRKEVAEQLAKNADWTRNLGNGGLRVASKFTRFTRDWFNGIGLPVDVVKLNGSVELAPVLGLAPFIVDLVETGSTLRANNLEVIQELAQIKVHLIANPAYFKFHYQNIGKVLSILASGGK